MVEAGVAQLHADVAQILVALVTADGEDGGVVALQAELALLVGDHVGGGVATGRVQIDAAAPYVQLERELAPARSPLRRFGLLGPGSRSWFRADHRRVRVVHGVEDARRYRVQLLVRIRLRL